jgi:hypothetical protein
MKKTYKFRNKIKTLKPQFRIIKLKLTNLRINNMIIILCKPYLTIKIVNKVQLKTLTKIIWKITTKQANSYLYYQLMIIIFQLFTIQTSILS